MGTSQSPAPPSRSYIRQIVHAALEEDLGLGDLTSSTLLSDSMSAKAQIISKEAMIVAGVIVAQEVLHQIDDTIIVQSHQQDGAWVSAQTPLLSLKGNARSLLQAERVALNFMQRLSGISTLTHQFCQAIRDHSVKIADTRKTTPGLRALEKWAVSLGGGSNHRSSLHDGILIKDNHLLVLAAHKTTLRQACQLARQHAPHGLRIEVEVETLAQVRQALQGQADIIMLDNMSPSNIQQAVRIIQGQALVEVSGGITLSNIREMAQTGVDIISIGALTHSARAMDISMDVIPLRTKPTPRRRSAHS